MFCYAYVWMMFWRSVLNVSHIWIYIDICIYIYAWIYLYIYVYKCIYVYVYMHMYLYTHIHIHIHIHIYIYTCTYTYRWRYIDIDLHRYICICTYKNNCVLSIFFSSSSASSYLLPPPCSHPKLRSPTASTTGPEHSATHCSTPQCTAAHGNNLIVTHCRSPTAPTARPERNWQKYGYVLHSLYLYVRIYWRLSLCKYEYVHMYI